MVVWLLVAREGEELACTVLILLTACLNILIATKFRRYNMNFVAI